MTTILIYHHLGLGDHFICNGLVRELLSRHDISFAYVVVKKHNRKTVQQMYLDDERIKLVPVQSNLEAKKIFDSSQCDFRYLIGFEACRTDFDVSFYESASVPFECRWSQFRVCRDREREKALEEFLEIGEEPFILVHDTPSYGTRCHLQINSPYRIVRVEPHTESLLDWYGLIERAQEVHCIDSSVLHLAQSIRNIDCFLHPERSTSFEVTLRNGWTRA